MGEMSILGKAGDTRVQWDRYNADEVGAARTQFDSLLAKGFAAFAVTKEGKKNDNRRLYDFNPAEESIIMVPQVAGGCES